MILKNDVEASIRKQIHLIEGVNHLLSQQPSAVFGPGLRNLEPYDVVTVLLDLVSAVCPGTPEVEDPAHRALSFQHKNLVVNIEG